MNYNYYYTGCSKKVCQKFSHLKDEKMLYGHRCGNAYFRSYVENTVSCITYTRKNLRLIIVNDNRLGLFTRSITLKSIFERVRESMRRCVTACIQENGEHFQHLL